MKKILFTVFALAIILGMSDCKEDNGEESGYLTVTYHKEGVIEGEEQVLTTIDGVTAMFPSAPVLPTEGEPPVDTKHYKKSVRNKNKMYEYDFVDTADILDQGTLAKEGCVFLAWKAGRISKRGEYQYMSLYLKFYVPEVPPDADPKIFLSQISVYDNIDLYPMWKRVTENRNSP